MQEISWRRKIEWSGKSKSMIFLVYERYLIRAVKCIVKECLSAQCSPLFWSISFFHNVDDDGDAEWGWVNVHRDKILARKKKRMKKCVVNNFVCTSLQSFNFYLDHCTNGGRRKIKMSDIFFAHNGVFRSNCLCVWAWGKNLTMENFSSSSF